MSVPAAYANFSAAHATLRRILRQSKTIAVVGLSANWWRPSFFAAKYMQEHGYRMIPVNPQYPQVLGQKCYASLREIPEKVDIELPWNVPGATNLQRVERRTSPQPVCVDLSRCIEAGVKISA